ncbi:MAG: hypothetical protein AB7Y46_15070 [Armatimonadota bacterium]
MRTISEAKPTRLTCSALKRAGRPLPPLMVALTVLLLGAVLLGGCGGSEPATRPAQRGELMTAAATIEQLQADLAAVGKPLPDFLADQPIQPSAAGAELIQPASYMTVLQLGRWLNAQSCAPGRVQWYECNLTNAWALTDVVVADRGGDPDLYVFSPLRALNARNSLKLVGYSVGTRDEQVGSFRARDFGGKGRFIVAVHAYGWSTARYDLRIW